MYSVRIRVAPFYYTDDSTQFGSQTKWWLLMVVWLVIPLIVIAVLVDSRTAIAAVRAACRKT